MIPRYEIKEISELWCDMHKFETFLQVELALLKSLEKNKIIPKGITNKIRNRTKIKLKEIELIEKETKHDVIAFVSSLTKQCGKNLGKYLHFGVTSSDIIDTALSIQIKETLSIIMADIDSLLVALKHLATKTKHLPCIGRSHGMFAEPMSFGQKWLSYYAEINRRKADLDNFLNHDLTMQISGAVGNYTYLSTKIEQEVAKELELIVEPVSTQILPRDRIAKLISINALLATSIERIATEIRHLHRSEVNEVCEGKGQRQKGSSIMPHKKNPISSENLCGIARVLRSHLNVALENIVLWHERDISHSSAERLMLPDNFGLLSYALKRLTGTLNALQINHKAIEDKIFSDVRIFSSFYLHYLLNHLPKLSREDAYEIVQTAAFKLEDPKDLDEFCEKIEGMFNHSIQLPRLIDLKSVYLKETDKIFNRVLRA